MEDALYEVESMRRFTGVSLDRIPDETTILNFRHFLERHGLGKKLFKEINSHIQDNGLMLREGTIVDATIIAAPSSTKNDKDEHDPEKCQAHKGKHPFLCIKVLFGFNKVRYRGLDKNSNRLHVLAEMTNLLIVQKYLLT